MGKRNLYLKTTPVQEAVEIYRREVEKRVKLSYETIPVTEALNRITGKAVYAKLEKLVLKSQKDIDHQKKLLKILEDIFLIRQVW